MWDLKNDKFCEVVVDTVTMSNKDSGIKKSTISPH